MIRVLVVEDSLTVRMLLVSLMNDDPDIQVVGEAANGNDAVLKAAKLQPDLITMDVEMPDMDGIEATRRIMDTIPTPILIVTAYTESADLNVAFEAMSVGALDIIGKPEAFGDKTSEWEKDLLSKVRTLANVHPWEEK